MEGRKPTGVFVALTNCKDEAVEEDYNRWYNDEHVVHCVGSGAYYTVSRWERITPDPWMRKFLAFYETAWEDPLAAADYLINHLRHDGSYIRFYIHPQLHQSWDVAYKYIGPDVHVPGAPWSKPAKKTRGLLLLFAQCADPAREADFNKWYDTVHIPDVLETPGVIAGHRFHNPNAEDETRRHVIVYEIDNEDTPGTFAKISKNIASKPKDRLIDYMKVTNLGHFRRIL